jgi:CheY-like chemotaxis protein
MIVGGSMSVPISVSVSNTVTSAAKLTARRLLVVEDEFIIASMIADQLAELGHIVVGPACSIEEAIQLATTAKLDGALLDWSLDGNSVGEVADVLAARGIPFLFMTGYNKIPDRSYAKIAILGKPFKMDELQRAIESAL